MHTIIVGAGIAGLWLAEQLALRGDKVTVLERADYLGGRIVSSDRGYEIGAGRIATHHTRVMELIRRFGLKTYPISGGGGLWLDGSGIESNMFDVNWSTFLHTFAHLSPRVLATRTLKQIATKILGSKQADRLLSHFGYRGETEVLRADLGLQAFQSEMASDSQFVVVAGGLTQVIKGLARAARKAGATILLNTTVNDVTEQFNVHTNRGVMTADRVILAIPSQALARLPCTRNLPVLRHLRMEPLTRIYATFDAPWPIRERIVTDSPLRYIIPIRDNLVMISYTEAQDTQVFKGLTGPALRKALQKEIKKILPDTPTITWAYAYEWAHGCTYWLPGTYDPVVESQKALRPMASRPGLHLCNESFSLRQAWVEGSLEHAASLLAIL